MRYLTVIIVFCCAVSCTRTNNVNLPPQEPRLVLHSYVAVGDTFKIALGRTFPQVAVVPPEDTYVSNGWVLLYENDVFVDSLKYKVAEQRYVSSRVLAAAGKLYKVRAGAAGYPDIEAFTIAPSAVNITSITRIKNARKTAFGSSLDDLKINFTDPPAANFYMARIQILNGDNCVFTYDPAVERYEADLVAFESGNCINGARILYTDRSFNGMAKELTLSMHSNSLDSLLDGSGNTRRPYIKKYNITEDYYRYLKTSLYQDIVFEEGSLLSEPRSPRGNVKNGYGLFTVFAVATDTIR